MNYNLTIDKEERKREMNKLLMFLCAVTLVFGMVGTANADIIFLDDFNRTPDPNVDLNDVGSPGGWYQGGGGSGPWSGVYEQSLTLGSKVGTGNNWTWAYNSTDLHHYTNVYMDFYWRASDSTDGMDRMWVAQSIDHGAWQGIWGPQLLGGSAYAHVILPINTNTNDYRFGFLSDFGGSDNDHEYVQFDNVRLHGEPVPEPATIALLGIGLAGLAGAEVRRRRKKKAAELKSFI